MDQVENLNHKSTKAKVEDKTEAIMTDAIMISEVIRTDISQIVEAGDCLDKAEVDQGMNKIIEEEILVAMQGCIKILRGKIVEKNTEISTEMKVIAEVEIGTGQIRIKGKYK